MFPEMSSAPASEKVHVKNWLAKWCSSENIRSDGWTAFAGFSPDADSEDAITVSANGSVRGDLEPGLVKGDVLTISVDVDNVDVVADFNISIYDDFGIPTNGQFAIAPVAGEGYNRYSATIDTSAMFGSTLESVAVDIVYTSGTKIRARRFFVERVTDLVDQSPSTYVPNSVSAQLNSYFHQASSIDPGISIANGACALMDQDGWCWGTSGLWTISSNKLNSLGVGRSLHSRQSAVPGKFYEYRVSVVDADMSFGLQIAGNATPAVTVAGSPAVGRVHSGTADGELVTGSGSAAPAKFSEIAIIECDADSGVDGIAFRDARGGLSVDPITHIVTE